MIKSFFHFSILIHLLFSPALAGFFPVVLAGAAPAKHKMEEIAEFEGGRLFRAGAIHTVVLSGNFRQMGRQYGKLLDSHLTNAYQAAFADNIISNKVMTFEQSRDFSRYVWNFYPARFKEFTIGAAETASLDIDRLIMLDQYMWLIIVKELDDSGACSMIAAFEKYTADEKALAGRNSDFPVFPDPSFFPPVVTVMLPDTGDIPVCNIGFPGQLQALTAMNANGLVVMQNNASLSGDKRRILDRVNNLTRALEWMFNADSLQFIEAGVNSMKSSHAGVILAVSSDDAIVYEAATHETRKRIGANRGLIVAGNHFINPAWAAPEESSALSQSLERRNNLLMHVEGAKGKLTPSGMMALLDVPAEDRGVSTKHTRLQVVLSLPDKTVWIKAPALQNWTEINIAPFFDGKP